jgi:GT2 family glycosyltransferase
VQIPTTQTSPSSAQRPTKADSAVGIALVAGADSDGGRVREAIAAVRGADATGAAAPIVLVLPTRDPRAFGAIDSEPPSTDSPAPEGAVAATETEAMRPWPDGVDVVHARSDGASPGWLRNAAVDELLRRHPGVRRIVLMSDDVRPERGCIGMLTSVLDATSDRCGAVAARLHDESRAPSFSGADLDRVRVAGRVRKTAHESGQIEPSDWVHSRCLCIDADLWRAGLRFDPAYETARMADLDFARALRTADLGVAVARDARAMAPSSARVERLETGGRLLATRERVRFARRWSTPVERLRFVAHTALQEPFGLLLRPDHLLAHGLGLLQGARLARPDRVCVRRPQRSASTPSSTRIAVVMLTRDAREDTLACLARLLPQLGSDDGSFVADNGSTDGTEELVRRRFPEVEYLQNGADLGHAGGSDLALARAMAGRFDWLLLVDNTARPDDGFVAAMRALADRSPTDVAAIQPLLVDADDPGRILSAGHELRRSGAIRPALAGRPVGDAPDPVDPTDLVPIAAACADACLLRARALRDIGLFDPSLFAEFADVDLMLRLRAEGWRIELAPQVHLPIVPRPRCREKRSERVARRFFRQRNAVALALRFWPRHLLLRHALRIALRALDARRLAPVAKSRGPTPCVPIWRRALDQRREDRAAARKHGLDEWLGRRVGSRS